MSAINYDFLGEIDDKPEATTYDSSQAFSLANPIFVSRYYVPFKRQEKVLESH